VHALYLAVARRCLVVGDESEDSLFDVLAQTRAVDDVSRSSRSFELLADQ